MTVTKTHYSPSAPPPVTNEAKASSRPRIAVLVMAFIGVGMWVAFNTTFQHAAKHVDNQVNCIGQTNSTC